VSTVLLARARGGCAPDGDGSPDRHGRTDDWVDGDHGRYHANRGIQAIVKDVDPGGGWPTLTKTNYVEWVVVMRIRLQERHMWEAVWYGDVDYYEYRRALDALIAAIPPEMQFSLSKKRTTKEA
jgi:hypothetical protein